jgi:hypothetical protein
MVVSKRFFSWSDVVIRRWLVRHPSFLVKIVQTRGVCSDDVLWEKPRLWSRRAGVAVRRRSRSRGHGLMRDGRTSVEMRRGYIGYVERGGDFRARTEPADAFGVFLQWDPAVFGKAGGPSMSRTPLAAADLARIEAHARADRQRRAGPRGGRRGALRRDRVARHALGSPRAGRSRSPPLAARRARGRGDRRRPLAIGRKRPMVVDLMRALDCSERQARYLVGEYVEAYALQGATEWRTLVNVWTTYLAGLLMTAKGATTEGVAGLLGYGSPNALCHALTNAGLPSPGEMRRIVAQLT